ncbi:PrsW family intramembrane metalloprotease [Streptomyces sp. NPDC007088]|uniref:PrsW family intramembrane metalloprotease n=1 Tax=Streptomyces sp. NPDC007088 TaxID=3364773 RepID=UPI00368A14C2
MLLLAVSGLVILALVRQQTGTRGFFVGLGLAVLPVPALILVFRLLGRVRPGRRRGQVFAFAWGACAAALIAIVANGFATRWIETATADRAHANTLGATVVAPIVEESAKAAAVLLVVLFRRRQIMGVVDAVVYAGVTAAGFAFTENILYLGNAFGTDHVEGRHGLGSVTLATFFVRAVMSPFAHPLFTCLTGAGFGLAALRPERRRAPRVLLPLAGLLLAMALHATWNLSPSFGPDGFPLVYGTVMVPALGLLTWLVLWHRHRDLRAVREELAPYVAGGWFLPLEPPALASTRSRRIAAEWAAYHGDRHDVRTVRRYAATATTLALLRRQAAVEQAAGGPAGGEFTRRERELLDALAEGRDLAGPAFAYTWRVAPPRSHRHLPVPAAWNTPATAHGYGYGQGHGHGPAPHGNASPSPYGEPARYGEANPYAANPPPPPDAPRPATGQT